MMRQRRFGFTLLECVATIVILGILAAVVLPRFVSHQDASQTEACLANRAMIQVQVERWFRRNGSWPQGNLGDIGVDTDYFPSGLPTSPIDGSSYTLNSTTHEVEGPDLP